MRYTVTTMVYYHSSDNFGNILLRIFSIAGMVTIGSGFALYFVSRGAGRKPQKQNPHSSVTINSAP